MKKKEKKKKEAKGKMICLSKDSDKEAYNKYILWRLKEFNSLLLPEQSFEEFKKARNSIN